MNFYLSCLLPFITLLSSATASGNTDQPETADATIIVIDSMEPGQTFRIAPGQLVRIPASAIAGSTITAQVTGPAKIVAHNRIVPMKENTGPNGERTLEPMIGTTEHEFLLQPTGAGEVTVTLTTRSPIPRVEPITKSYHFSVE